MVLLRKHIFLGGSSMIIWCGQKYGNNISITILVLLLAFLQLVATISSSSVSSDFPNERNALIQLRDLLNSSNGNFHLHSNWTGPPCYVNQSKWTGIACSNGHVTRLVLQGLQLNGSIPSLLLQNLTFLTKLSLANNLLYGPLPNLSHLLDLQFVFLSRNHFSGSIPFSYVQLPNLTGLELQENGLIGSIPPFDQQTLVDFNVSNNQLQGLIPDTKVLQRFSKNSYQNNPSLCGSPVGVKCPVVSPPPSPSSKPAAPPPPAAQHTSIKLWPIALIAAAAALLPLLIMFFFLFYVRRFHKKANTQSDKSPGGAEAFVDGGGARKKAQWSASTEDPERRVELEFFDKNRPVFDLDDLLRASAEIIGKGRLGTTYKAILESGPVVAVKRLKGMDDLSRKEFSQQLQLLGGLKHDNLVELISFHYAKDERLIVYEYVPGGNLFHLLHENRGIGRQPLNWKARLSMIKDITSGLNFLHQSLPSHKVPHGNLKSSNIVLTLRHASTQGQGQGGGYQYQCKLSDYGFFQLFPYRKSLENLAVAKSPEFYKGRRLSAKTDVYCLGVVILEIITGKTPCGPYSPRSEESEPEDMISDLSNWVRAVVHSDWSTDILDMEILAEKEGYEEMLTLTKLGLECTEAVTEKRPKMSQVWERIQEIIL